MGMEPSRKPRWKSRKAQDRALAKGLGVVMQEIMYSNTMVGVISADCVWVRANAPQAELLDAACIGNKATSEDVVPEPVITLHDRECEESNDGEDSVRQQHYVRLSFEEALFLNLGGCLQIFSELASKGEHSAGERLWKIFHKSRPFFVYEYKAYTHLRSKHWVVRGGLQYSAHYVAYRHHPANVHSEYAVVVIPEKDESRVGAWPDVQALSRLCTTVAKGVLLLYVSTQNEEAEGTDEIEAVYKRLMVKEVLLERWLPERHRDTFECK